MESLIPVESGAPHAKVAGTQVRIKDDSGMRQVSGVSPRGYQWVACGKGLVFQNSVSGL